jgi:hypothetical protein
MSGDVRDNEIDAGYDLSPTFVRLPEGNLLVVLPPVLRSWLSAVARAVEDVASQEQGPLGLSLFGPVNLEVDQDDVVVLLQRQMTVEAAVADVIANESTTEITIEQALDWLRVVQLGIRVVKSPAGEKIATSLDVRVDFLTDVLHLLSHELVVALEPAATPEEHA